MLICTSRIVALRRRGLAVTTGFVLAFAVAALPSLASGTTYSRWNVTAGKYAYVSASENGTAYGDSFVLGYLFGAGKAGRASSDCANLDDAIFSTTSGNFHYGDLSPAGCSNTVGAWHISVDGGSNTRCMWVRTLYPPNYQEQMSQSYAVPISTTCTTHSAGDGGLWAGGSHPMFEPATWQTAGGPPDSETNAAAMQQNCGVWANYDPVTHAVPAGDADGSETSFRGTPGYAPGLVTTPVDGFLSRYRTIDRGQVLLKDSSRTPSSWGITPWGFVASGCIAGRALGTALSRTDPATAVSPTSATVAATVEPNGFSTSVSFEYGPTAAYGSSATAPSVTGTAVVTASKALVGLASNTTYHYRVVTRNTGPCTSCGTNTSYGADATFTTPPNPVGASDLGEFDRSPGGSWQTWDVSSISAGPTIVGRPSSINDPGNNELLVFARGTDNHLYSFRRSSGGAWQTLDITSLSGGWTLAGEPVAFKDPGNGELLVFALGGSGHLLQLRRTSAGAWSGYDLTNIAGGVTIAGTPSVIVDPGNSELLAFARDASGRLVSFERTAGGAWNAWDISALSGGAMIANDPTAFRDPGNGHLLAFAQTAAGSLLSFDRSSAGAWSTYNISTATGAGIAGVPRPFVDPSSSHILVFASGASNHLTSFDRSTGGVWSALDISNNAGGTPIASNAWPIRDPGNGLLLAFARGGAGHLLEYQRTAGGSWNVFDVTNLAGAAAFVAGDPAPWVDPGNSHLLAFGTGG